MPTGRTIGRSITVSGAHWCRRSNCSAAVARMALYYPEAPCAVCGEAIGADERNILGFDFIEIPQREFQHFGDGLAHISCLSSWERRDEFIQAWNRALGEYYVGKQLRVDGDGRVDYTDSETWHIQHSLAVQRRNAAQLAKLQEEAQRRRADLGSRMDAARQKAIRLGLASSVNVDRIIHDMALDEFRQQFDEFHVSRVFFKNG
jgi:hypothetical protein